MRAFADAWPESEIVQEVLAQLPWYRQLALLDKLENREERYPIFLWQKLVCSLSFQYD